MIEGKLVRLRATEEADLPLFCKWLNDTEVTQFLRAYLPMPLKNEQEWFDRMRNDKESVHFAIAEKKGGKLIGNTALMKINPVDRNAEFGIFIGDKRYWSKGYGSEAARLCLCYAFDTLNLHRVGSSAIGYNERSIRMHLKLGFKREGVRREEVYKKGKYWDHPTFGMLREEFKR